MAYYTRLEQGNGRNVSAEVLDAIARALRLTEAEHAHLTALAKPTREKHRPAPQRVRPALQELLDAIDGIPAYIWGRRTNVLAWNRTASALFSDWSAHAPKASDVVGQLRLDAGAHPNDALLAELVGELSVKSDAFRTMWATHNVKRKSHDSMRINHPLVGELTVRYETFTLAGADQALETYHAEPGSTSEQALRLLASWGADATQQRQEIR